MNTNLCKPRQGEKCTRLTGKNSERRIRKTTTTHTQTGCIRADNANKSQQQTHLHRCSLHFKSTNQHDTAVSFSCKSFFTESNSLCQSSNSNLFGKVINITQGQPIIKFSHTFTHADI